MIIWFIFALYVLWLEKLHAIPVSCSHLIWITEYSFHGLIFEHFSLHVLQICWTQGLAGMRLAVIVIQLCDRFSLCHLFVVVMNQLGKSNWIERDIPDDFKNFISGSTQVSTIIYCGHWGKDQSEKKKT